MLRALRTTCPCLLVVTGALLTLLSAGCDEDITQQEFTQVETPDLRDNEEVTIPDAVEDTTPQGPCCFLIPLGGVVDHQVHVGTTMSLGVVLYELGTGQVVPNAQVSWAIEADGGQKDAQISALNSFTDAGGVAMVDFIGGLQQTSYRLTASYIEGDPVTFNVGVMELPNGDLEVTVINSGASQMEVAPIDVYLYSAQSVRCRTLSPLNMPQNYLAQAAASRDGEVVRFEGLLEDEEYVVAGVGYGPNGNVVADGCVEGVGVVAEQTEMVDLILQLIPLNPVGSYRSRGFYNLGDALAQSGTVGAVIMEIFDGFANPGQLIYDQIFNLCSNFVPSFFCDALKGLGGITGIDDLVQDAINDAITSTSFGCDMIQIGCDIRETIRGFELTSTIYMSKVGADYTILGRTTYDGMAIELFGGRWELDLAAMADQGVELLAGDWTGVIVGYDKLTISNHPLDLNYGELISYVINHLMLPALTSNCTPAPAHSIEEALACWINCDGIAESISDIEVLGQSISYDAAYNLCTGAVGGLSSLLNIGDAILSLQDIESVVQLSGDVRLVDLNGDFQVDELLAGEWFGVMRFSGGNSAPIDAVWTGCNHTANPECEIPFLESNFADQGTCSCDEQ